MGLAIPSIELLLKEHQARPLKGPVLTLGRQNIIGTYEHLLNLFYLVGLVPAPLAPSITAMESVPLDTLLFAHMGLELQVLDLSEFERPDIIQNLNEPISESHYGQFGTVIDGGTIEHIFDVRSAFVNIADLLAPDGRVIHMTPCNNYVNHGFWQVSPTSFFDYYEANGFTDLQALMIVQPRDYTNSRSWGVFPYDPQQHGFLNSMFSSRDDHLACMFSARKTATSTSRVVPMQSYFVMREKAAKQGFALNGPHWTLEYTVDPPGLKVLQVPYLE